jgi:hypothetical protein
MSSNVGWPPEHHTNIWTKFKRQLPRKIKKGKDRMTNYGSLFHNSIWSALINFMLQTEFESFDLDIDHIYHHKQLTSLFELGNITLEVDKIVTNLMLLLSAEKRNILVQFFNETSLNMKDDSKYNKCLWSPKMLIKFFGEESHKIFEEFTSLMVMQLHFRDNGLEELKIDPYQFKKIEGTLNEIDKDIDFASFGQLLSDEEIGLNIEDDDLVPMGFLTDSLDPVGVLLDDEVSADIFSEGEVVTVRVDEGFNALIEKLVIQKTHTFKNKFAQILIETVYVDGILNLDSTRCILYLVADKNPNFEGLDEVSKQIHRNDIKIKI